MACSDATCGVEFVITSAWDEALGQQLACRYAARNQHAVRNRASL